MNPGTSVLIINAAKQAAMEIGQRTALDVCGEASFGVPIRIGGKLFEVNVTITPLHTYTVPRDREQWREVA